MRVPVGRRAPDARRPLDREGEPPVSVRFVHGLRRWRKIVLGKTTDGDGDGFGFAHRFPVNRRAALRAEMKDDIEPRIRPTAIHPCRAFHGNARSIVERSQTECASRSPLALPAMTQGNEIRFADTSDDQRAAGAGGGSCPHAFLRWSMKIIRTRNPPEPTSRVDPGAGYSHSIVAGGLLEMS